jgi:hypothetical protein
MRQPQLTIGLLTVILVVSCSNRAPVSDIGPLPDQQLTSDGPLPEAGTVPDAPQTRCPASVPQEGSACSDEGLAGCEYLIQPCPCGPSDLYWHCECRNGGWACTRDYDCYPCDGGLGFDTGPCPPPLPCNWCNGTPILDSKGCVIGYKCANGADPCVTQPCSQTPPTGCKPNEVCGPDMLCWPGPDGGIPVTCSGGPCYGSSAGDCGCEWTCSDGNSYKVTCVPGSQPGAMSCQCLVNSSLAASCVMTGGISSCNMNAMAQCCSFPP